MTLTELANLGEAFGGLAVLVSLVYLAMEVRRNTKTARSTASWNATVTLGELCEGISNNADLSALVVRASDADARPENPTEE